MSKPELTTHLQGWLDGQSRRAFYDRLYAGIQASISDRLLEPGELLPSERELSSDLGVSRNVIRRVLSDLESEGILSTRHGYGTFVPRELRKSTNSILGFSEEMSRRGKSVGNRILRFMRRAASAGEAIEIGLSLSDPLLEIVRVRLADELPIVHELCLVPAWTVSPDYDGNTSLYAHMEERGTRPIRVLQEISAAPADAEVADSLAIEPGFPVLRITRKGFNQDNVVVEYTSSAFRSDRYTWITELHR